MFMLMSKHTKQANDFKNQRSLNQVSKKSYETFDASHEPRNESNVSSVFSFALMFLTKYFFA